jgi:hypothetical protein
MTVTGWHLARMIAAMVCTSTVPWGVILLALAGSALVVSRRGTRNRVGLAIAGCLVGPAIVFVAALAALSQLRARVPA